MSFDGRSGLTIPAVACSSSSVCPWFADDSPPGNIVRVCPEAAHFPVSCPVTQPRRPLTSVSIGLASYHPERPKATPCTMDFTGHISFRSAYKSVSSNHFERLSLLPAAGSAPTRTASFPTVSVSFTYPFHQPTLPSSSYSN